MLPDGLDKGEAAVDDFDALRWVYKEVFVQRYKSQWLFFFRARQLKGKT